MSTRIRVENRAGLKEEEFLRLEGVLTHQHSVRDALDWLRRQVPPLTMQDVVTQDEFSHDILVSYSDQLYLVYDST
jgi:hypothetical protein